MQQVRTGVRQNRARSKLLLATVAAFMTLPSLAAAGDLNTQHQFRIPPQPLDTALLAFSDQANVQVLMWAGAQPNATSAGVFGQLSVLDALQKLLGNTTLAFKQIDDETVAIISAASAAAATSDTRPDSERTNVMQAAGRPLRLAQAQDTASPAYPSSMAAAATAQDGQRESMGIQEVVVTARRRAESMQDVPISVTAIGEAVLDSKGVAVLRDLEFSVPGLTYTDQGAAFGGFGIRGIFTLVRSTGVESGVGVYVDGVYQGRNSNSNLDLVDVERVEVLKGPQGTLFGRNTISGAVNITTQAPSEQFETKIKASVGNLDMRSVNASLSGPIVDGKLLARVSGSLFERDGYTLNLYDGEHLNNQDRANGRLRLRFLATDQLTFDFSADKFKDDANVNRGGYLVSSVPGRFYGVAAEFAQTSDPRVTSLDNFDLGSVEKRDVSGTALTGTYEFGDGFTFSSISAYRDGSFYTASDFDGTAAQIAGGNTRSDSSQFTQEFRLDSRAARQTGFSPAAIDYVAGLFYLTQDTSGRLHTLLGTGCTVSTCPRPGLPGPDVFGPISQIDTESYAAYVNANWRLSRRFTLTGGLRYTSEDKSLDFQQDAALGIGIPAVPPSHFERSENNVSPTLSLRYEAADDVSMYATIARGYKSGGFNADVVSNLNIVFGPEEVTNYEVGFKSLLFDHRARFNVAVFYVDYQDLQVQQFVGTAQQVTNAAKAEIKGVELELSARLIEHLTLDLGAAYINAEFADFPNATGAGANYAGNKLASAPDYTGSVALEYTHAVATDANIFVRGEWTYRGNQYFQADNAPFTQQEGYSLFNGRVGIDLSDGKYRLSIFGNNLDDKIYATNRLPFLGTQMGFWGEPRTYGVELIANF